MNPDFWLQLILAVCAGVGVYVAIRVDLVTAKLRAEQAIENAGKAHDKIDTHLNDHWKGVHHGN